MNMKKGLTFGGIGVIVVVALALGLTFGLGGSNSGETPGKKVMADTKAYLMEVQRLFGDKGKLKPDPQLCWCCDREMVDGDCPNCKGSCDQGQAAGTKHRVVANAPVSEVDAGAAGAGAGAAASGGGGCGCDY